MGSSARRNQNKKRRRTLSQQQQSINKNAGLKTPSQQTTLEDIPSQEFLSPSQNMSPTVVNLNKRFDDLLNDDQPPDEDYATPSQTIGAAPIVYEDLSKEEIIYQTYQQNKYIIEKLEKFDIMERKLDAMGSKLKLAFEAMKILKDEVH
eukprot:TCONS_00052132-protein